MMPTAFKNIEISTNESDYDCYTNMTTSSPLSTLSSSSSSTSSSSSSSSSSASCFMQDSNLIIKKGVHLSALPKFKHMPDSNIMQAHHLHLSHPTDDEINSIKSSGVVKNLCKKFSTDKIGEVVALSPTTTTTLTKTTANNYNNYNNKPMTNRCLKLPNANNKTQFNFNSTKIKEIASSRDRETSNLNLFELKKSQSVIFERSFLNSSPSLLYKKRMPSGQFMDSSNDGGGSGGSNDNGGNTSRNTGSSRTRNLAKSNNNLNELESQTLFASSSNLVSSTSNLNNTRESESQVFENVNIKERINQFLKINNNNNNNGNSSVTSELTVLLKPGMPKELKRLNATKISVNSFNTPASNYERAPIFINKDLNSSESNSIASTPVNAKLTPIYLEKQPQQQRHSPSSTMTSDDSQASTPRLDKQMSISSMDLDKIKYEQKYHQIMQLFVI